MKAYIVMCAASLLIASCATQTVSPGNSGNGWNAAAVQAGTSENGVRTANSPQDTYDQPGALPANSGGTDAGASEPILAINR